MIDICDRLDLTSFKYWSISALWLYNVKNLQYLPLSCSHSLQERAENPEKVRLAEEQEDAEIEKKKEEDDPELLQRARRMDEFKDGNYIQDIKHA